MNEPVLVGAVLVVLIALGTLTVRALRAMGPRVDDDNRTPAPHIDLATTHAPFPRHARVNDDAEAAPSGAPVGIARVDRG